MTSTTLALTVLTIISSIALRISPLPDFYWVVKHKTTGDVALLSVVTLAVNNACMAFYAYTIEDIAPLLVTSVFGMCTAVGFIWVFAYYSQETPYVVKVCGGAAAITALLLVYTILAMVGATHQSRHQTGQVLGWCMIVATIAQYASPLATLRKILETKSAASLPFTMCVMNVLNGALWVAYAALVSDMFVLAPNIGATALGVAQVVLWVMYRPTRIDKIPTVVTGDGTALRASFSIQVVPNPVERLARVSSSAAETVDFVELVSPTPHSLVH